MLRSPSGEFANAPYFGCSTMKTFGASLAEALLYFRKSKVTGSSSSVVMVNESSKPRKLLFTLINLFASGDTRISYPTPYRKNRILLNSLHLNGYTSGIHLQAKALEPPCTEQQTVPQASTFCLNGHNFGFRPQSQTL